MTSKTRQQTYLSRRVQGHAGIGIRRFFDLLGSIDGVISLGVGEPDFVTPWHIRDAESARWSGSDALHLELRPARAAAGAGGEARRAVRSALRPDV